MVLSSYCSCILVLSRELAFYCVMLLSGVLLGRGVTLACRGNTLTIKLIARKQAWHTQHIL